MTLRRRTLLIVGGGLAAAAALALAVSLLVTRRGFLELEEESVRADVERAVRAVGAAVDEVTTLADDWATWDDTYGFVETGDPAWTSVTMVPEALTTIRVGAVIVADRAGRVAAETALDPETLAVTPVPLELRELLAGGGAFAPQAGADGGWSGLLRLPGGGTALVAARPILRSNRQGPSRGTLLMARFVDAGEVKRLAELTSLGLTLCPIDGPGLEVRAAQDDVLVERVDRDTVAGSTVLRDLAGRPALLLRVESPRSTVRLGQRTMLLMGGMILLTGLVLGLGTLLQLERSVLAPLGRLVREVDLVAATRDPSTRVSASRRDELGALGVALNRMLAALGEAEQARRESDERVRGELERTNEELEARVRERTAELERAVRSLEGEVAERQHAEEQARRAEARYRHTVDTAVEGFYRTTLDGRFELVNPALAQILGFDSADALAKTVIGADYSPYLAPERRLALLAQLEAHDRVVGFESELIRKDGSFIWVSENVSAVRDASGRLTGLEGSLVDVSERKRAARELQASEARYRELADFLPQPVFELDANGVPTYVNRAALEWYGPGVEGLLGGGKVLLDLVVPEQRKQTYGAFERALAGERLTGLELTAVRGDGSRVPVLVFASPVERDGVPAGARILAVDISGQRAVEAALRESEQRQASVLRSLPVAVYTATVPSRQDANWMSDSVQRFTGFPAERFVTEPGFWTERLHPLDAERAAREYRMGVARGEVTVEYRWRVADGSYRWFADSALCTRMEDGVAGVTGVIRDITAEKKAVEAVRRSELYYRGLFDGAHDAIVVFDPETEIVLDANAAACAVYQLSRAELVGLSLETVSKDVEKGKRRIEETLERGSILSFETVQLRGDGSEVQLEVNASVVDFHGKPAILSLNRDVSERRALEERLRQAEKMEAVGQLAAGVAHDFNNILAVILSRAELSLRQCGPGDPHTLELEVVRDAALRGRDLTRSLLGFSRHQILERRSLDLGSVVEGMLPILRGFLPAGITLRVVGAESRAAVYADQGQVEQILLNLAVNARDAMPEGGELSVEVAPVEVGDEFLAGRPWARAGRYGRLLVRDSGVGMDEAVLARALEPFFTTKGRAGTGLGLATVYGIAKQHGGMIEIASQPGRGTVVEVYLPEGVGEAEEATLRPTPGEPARGRGERILVADDEPALLEVIAIFLADLNYEVVTVADGHDALATLVEATEPFALVVTDLSMPHLGGVDLFHAARARGLDAGFVFTTGHHEDAVRGGLPSGPRVGFLRKPYDLDALAAMLRAILESAVATGSAARGDTCSLTDAVVGRSQGSDS